MSKIETLNRLAREQSQPALQIVESVQTLQQTVGTLPAAVAAETAAALEPLAALRLDVQRVLEAYDQVTAIQRRTLDELTQQMSASAAASMEQRVSQVDKTLRELGAQVQSLRAATAAAEASSKAMQALPRQIAASAAQAAEQMQSSAGDLAQQADRARPRRWLQALALVLAGLVGGLAAAAGQAGLSRLLPPGAVQERAAALDALWSRATPQERELLKQIVNRPAN